MDRKRAKPPRMPAFHLGQLAAGFVAGALAVAVVAGLVYSRNSAGFHNSPGGTENASAARLISPEGLAVGPDGAVYVSDYLTNRVFRLRPDGSLVVVAGGGVNSDGPATKANLAHPAGLAFDVQGRLYIADNLGGAIRRIDSRGTISTVVALGTGTTILNGPTGLAFDNAGVLYIGDFGGELLELDPNGNLSSLDTSALPKPALFPGYLAFDSSGNLYVADRAPVQGGGIYSPGPGGGCRIVRLTPDRKFNVVAGTGTCGFSGDGGPATKAQLDDPNGIAFDSAGNLYFSDANNHRIRRVDAKGIITTVAGTGAAGHGGDGGPASSATLGYPFGLAIGNGDLLYVSDAPCQCMVTDTTGRVRMIRLSDGTITTVASSQSRVIASP
jgi:sugar lactone lactonase YvrE